MVGGERADPAARWGGEHAQPAQCRVQRPGPHGVRRRR
jgi:hypothetical protein